MQIVIDYLPVSKINDKGYLTIVMKYMDKDEYKMPMEKVMAMGVGFFILRLKEPVMIFNVEIHPKDDYIPTGDAEEIDNTKDVKGVI